MSFIQHASCSFLNPDTVQYSLSGYQQHSSSTGAFIILCDHKNRCRKLKGVKVRTECH